MKRVVDLTSPHSSSQCPLCCSDEEPIEDELIFLPTTPLAQTVPVAIEESGEKELTDQVTRKRVAVSRPCVSYQLFESCERWP